MRSKRLRYEIMFHFFMALFGMTNLIFRGNACQTRRIAYENEAKQLSQNRERFLRMLQARHGEEEYYQTYVSSAHREEICNLLNEDLRSILGYRRWREFFRVEPYADWIYHLLLASHGYMDSFHILDGFIIHGNGSNKRSQDLKFIKSIERKLKSKGKNVHFVIPNDKTCGERVVIKELCIGGYTDII